MRHTIPAATPVTSEQARAARLFQPGALGPVNALRRTWVPAMVPWRSNESGEVTQDVLDWYARFAQGRPGVLVVEATGIRDIPSGPLLRIGTDSTIDGLKRLVDTVREHSGGETRLFIQIIDFLSIRRRPEKEKFLERFLEIRHEHRSALLDRGYVASSDEEVRAALARLDHDDLLKVLNDREREDLEFGHRERVTDMHLDHIRDLPKQLPDLFARAAQRAELAGFDGVELHFAHAYTMASFLSATNTRNDDYGGGKNPFDAKGLANRARLPLDVFHAVRAATDRSTFAVGCRMLGDEVIDGGTRVHEAAHFAALFAKAGMDFISISKGGKFDDARQPKVGAAAYPYTGESGHECMPTVRVLGANEDEVEGPLGRNLPLARRIRETVREYGYDTPIVAAGGLNDFAIAEEALADPNPACDFVASARQSLADPDWFLKTEQGRTDEIRRCKYTNYCEALDERHKEVTCQLWDRIFDDPDFGRDTIAKSEDGKRRLVAPPDPNARA